MRRNTQWDKTETDWEHANQERETQTIPSSEVHQGCENCWGSIEPIRDG